MTEFINMLIIAFNSYWQKFIDKLPVLMMAFIVLFIFWLIARLGEFLITNIVNKFKDLSKTEIALVIGRLLRAGIIIIGIVIALGVAGIHLSALLTSLGLIGFALSFVLRDYIKDFLAGIIILTQKPFVVSDEIKVGKMQGIVESIEVRFTVLKTSDNRKILIANSDILSKAVEISTAYNKRRVDLEISFKELKNSDKLNDVMIMIKGEVRKIEEVETNSDIKLLFIGIEDEKVKLKLSLWTKLERSDIEIGKSLIIEKLYWILRSKKMEGVKIA